MLYNVIYICIWFHWIGFVGKILTGNPWVFTIKLVGLSCKFSHHPILWRLIWIIWVNLITTSLFSRSLGIMVYFREIIPKVAELFRLVKYNLPRLMSVDLVCWTMLCCYGLWMLDHDWWVQIKNKVDSPFFFCQRDFFWEILEFLQCLVPLNPNLHWRREWMGWGLLGFFIASGFPKIP